MRTMIAHPVPVRWTPPRARLDRVGFELAETSVEIPEVAHGTLERNECGYSLRDGYVAFRIHAGRCFARVTAGMLGKAGRPRDQPATVGEVLSFLSVGGAPAPLVTVRGTPLCARVSLAGPGMRGERLPDPVHARARGDNTAAARAALERHVRDCLVTDGEAFYVARSMPVLHLASWQTGYILDRHPDGVADGVGFEPARLGLVGDVTARMAGWYRRGEVAGKIGAAVEALRSAFAHLPYADDDLAAFRNDGPDAVARLLARARERKVPEAALRAAAAHEARLRPYADLGRIGAVAAADVDAVEDLLCTAVRAIAAAIPEGEGMIGVRNLAAYVEGAVVPRRLASALPEGDAEALGDLSPESVTLPLAP